MDGVEGGGGGGGNRLKVILIKLYSICIMEYKDRKSKIKTL